MKMALLPLALSLVLALPAVSAHAEEQAQWRLLIIDKDPKGTNVRDAPSGKVIKTIPFTAAGTLREVTALTENKGWFQVDADGVRGWMHSSVLGICASPTEDGDPALTRGPADDSAVARKLPAGAPVTPTGMQGRWLKVRYMDGKGKAHEGWLPEQSAVLSENGMEECAQAWARRK